MKSSLSPLQTLPTTLQIFVSSFSPWLSQDFCPVSILHCFFSLSPSACWQPLSSLSHPSDFLLFSFCQPRLLILIVKLWIFLSFFDPTDVKSDCLSVQHQFASR